MGYGRDTQSLMLMVTPRIIINSEEEERALGGTTGGGVLGGGLGGGGAGGAGAPAGPAPGAAAMGPGAP